MTARNVVRVISTKRMREGFLRARSICWCEKQQEIGATQDSLVSNGSNIEIGVISNSSLIYKQQVSYLSDMVSKEAIKFIVIKV